MHIKEEEEQHCQIHQTVKIQIFKQKMGDSTRNKGESKDLPTDYNSLLKEYNYLKKALDCCNQELHDSKRHLKVAEALQFEYQSEIEHLQQNQNFGNKELHSKISRLEEEIVKSRLTNNDRISYLEQCLENKETECANLQEELKVIKKTISCEPAVDDSSKLAEELNLLKDANEEISEIVTELSLNLKESQKNCAALESKLEALQNEYESVKESLDCKREEVYEANDLVQILNDEILCLKSELEVSKSVPLDQKSQGNSLFAEVDDRRVVLQKSVNTMKQEYESMVNDRGRLLDQINKLSKERLLLLERWSKVEDEIQEDDEMVLNSYKSQIKVLKNSVAAYKKYLKYKPPNMDNSLWCDMMQFYEKKLKEKDSEIFNLDNDLTKTAFVHTLMTQHLAAANKSSRQLKLEVSLLKCEMDILIDKLKELGVPESWINSETKYASQKLKEEQDKKLQMNFENIAKENDMLYNTSQDLSDTDITLDEDMLREIEEEISREKMLSKKDNGTLELKKDNIEILGEKALPKKEILDNKTQELKEKNKETVFTDDVIDLDGDFKEDFVLTPRKSEIIVIEDFKEELVFTPKNIKQDSDETVILLDDEEKCDKPVKNECFVIYYDEEENQLKPVKNENKENTREISVKENLDVQKENSTTPLKSIENVLEKQDIIEIKEENTEKEIQLKPVKKENTRKIYEKENLEVQKENSPTPLNTNVLEKQEIKEENIGADEPKKENAVKILKDQNVPKASGLPTKKVTFSNSTVEPKTTERHLLRGGRVIKAKQTFYFK